MSKGGDTTTTNTTTSLPEFAQPYYEDLLAKAKNLSNQTYTPYQGQRLAGFSDDTNDSFDMIRDMASAGTPGFDAAIRAATGIAGYRANPINSTNVTATGTTAGNVTSSNVGAAGTTADQVHAGNVATRDFTSLSPAQLQQYMNPYTQNVLDTQKQRATQTFQEQQASRDADAVRAGAYGGSRRFVADSLAQRDLNQQLQDMDAQGLAAAFTNAQNMWTGDVNRRVAVDTGNVDRQLLAATGNADRRLQSDTNDANRLLQADISNADRRLQADTGNMDRRLLSDTNDANRILQAQTGNADRGLQAATASEEARRLGAGLGLDAAQQLGVLSTAKQASGLDLASALSGVGAKEQQRTQAGLDLAYQDFINQRDWGQNRTSLYSQLLSGTPISPNTSTATTTPAPDFLSQLLGLGAGAAGIWNLLN